jgi:formylglycine-generating enzyme
MGLLDLSYWDNYKNTIEALSGGKNTVLFDDLDLPSVMVRIPRFNITDVGLAKPAGAPAGEYGEAMPAFRGPTGYGESGLLTSVLIGKYIAYEYGTRAYSLPYKDPKISIDFDDSKSRCTSKGTGWHLVTNAEWAAIAQWSRENGTMPRGNNQWLEDADDPHESAVPTQTGVVKGVSGTARSYTGSGPDSWNHDHTAYGIADMNGNVWEWTDGLKITDTVAAIMPDKDGSDPGNDFTALEAAWIDTATDITAGMTSGHKILTLRTGDLWTGLGIPATADATGSATYGYDYYYYTATGERMARRGGHWSTDVGAGVFALVLSNLRSATRADVGFRLAFAS